MLKFPLALLMTLWLPLHGVAAVAMPFCSQSHQPDTAQPDPIADREHHHQRGTTDATASTYGVSPHGYHVSDDAPHLQCDGCGPCHLACSPMVGVTAVPLGVAGSQQHLLLAQAFPPAHAFDQPHPPPLA